MRIHLEKQNEYIKISSLTEKDIANKVTSIIHQVNSQDDITPCQIIGGCMKLICEALIKRNKIKN